MSTQLDDEALDALLREAGATWRAEQPPPPTPDWSRLDRGRPRSWWPAAVAAGVAVLMVGVIVGLVVRGDDSATTAISAPGAATAIPTPLPGPTLPHAAGATVPAPLSIPMSRPAPQWCRAADLTGVLTYRYRHGRETGAVLTLRRRDTTAPSCPLPAELPDRRAIELLDLDGHVWGVGTAPATTPTNPPLWTSVPLSGSATASVYTYSAQEPPCLGSVTHARVTIRPGQSLSVPVDGLAKCVDRYDDTGFFYGPLSPDGHPVAAPPGSWNQLRAALDFPDRLTGGDVSFPVTLTNRGRTTVRLDPCPQFGLLLEGTVDTSHGHPVALRTGSIGCPARPRTIAPGHRLRLRLSVALADEPAGRYRVSWAIAGVPTARATTTVS